MLIMQSILEKESYKGMMTYVYIPTIKHDAQFGSLNLEKNIFDNLIKHLLKKLGKYSKTSEIIYENENLTYKIINKKDRKLIQTLPVETVCEGSYIVNIVNEKVLGDGQFPVINKYPNICKRNKMTFVYNSINVSLITESYSNDESTYFFELSFTNNNINPVHVEEMIKFMSNNMF